jgi:DNA repair protein RadC
MSQLSFSSFDDALLVRDAQGRYLPASVDQILEAAGQAIEQKMQRGAEFSSPAVVKEYLRTKLAGFEHEVFAVLFLDTRHRLIEYAADKALTQRLKESLALVEIRTLDHVIVAGVSTVSFAEHGLL